MTDETVLVTGCSSGIGRATATLFADEGWTVYATARDVADVEDLATETCHTAELDVTSPEDIDRVIDRVTAEQDHLDCLVNNAGYAQHGPLEDIDVERLHRQFDVNLYGPHRLIRALLPHMREAGTGTIVNVSSVSGRIAIPGTGAYSASKFALEAASDALRGEVAEFGVDVVLVEPGPVHTNFAERTRTELDAIERREDVYSWLYEVLDDANILGGSAPFAAEPDDVAAVIHEAAETTDPHPRYPVGRTARLLLLARFLPDDLRDLGLRVARRLT